tara:strand:+ start:267 stop:902 length:636 start_codon:yes stop_codon:yes gene_type:complete
MKKLITLVAISIFASISIAISTEFNENSIYSGKVERAYNQVDIPLLPGNWKILDLEKSGSVPSGNFFVYATLVPESFGPNDNNFFNDSINYAVLGANSEETDYRKSFYGCDSSFYTAATTNTTDINYRGLGNFEESCSALPELDQVGTLAQFYLTDCNEICVEVNFTLFMENYKINENNFEALSKSIFDAIRSTMAGNGSDESFAFLSNYQ